MAMKLIAYGYENNARANKSLVAAKFAGVDVAFVSFDDEKDQSMDFVRNCSPCGRNPVLQTEEGYLFESNAILRHVARCDKTGALYGRTNFEASQIDSWVDFSATELDANSLYFVLVKFGLAKASPEQDCAKTAGLLEALTGLEQWLENRTWLVGERITVADIAVGFSLEIVYRYTANAELFTKFPNCVRMYNTVYMQPQTQEALKARGADASPATKPE